MSEKIHSLVRENDILTGLPHLDWERLAPHLEEVEVEQGTVLHEAGASGYAYFPTTATVSLLYLMEDGASPEIAVVGSEGLVANTDFFGNYAASSQAVVQSSGRVYRLAADRLKAELECSTTLLRLMMNYAQDLFRQMAQTIVSIRHQPIEIQVCRRLLLGLDRLPSNTMAMTHELMANILNVRREGVTKAAGRLQSEGLITYFRGHITVIDRAGLEARAGECYAALPHA